MPKSKTVKQLQIQKAKLAKQLFSSKSSATRIRYYTSRILGLNSQICRAKS